MPVKPLPKSLVFRLKKVSSVIVRFLGKMKNVDYRKNDFSRKKIMSENTFEWGRRIRQMNVSRNYPEVKLVVKRTHNDRTATHTELKEIQSRVKNYNKKIKQQKKRNESFVLREPIAYDIGNGLVAMAKTNKPSVNEILGHIKYFDSKGVVLSSTTIKGTRFFRKLSKKHGVNKEQLESAAIQLFNEISIMPTNILLLGVNKKKQFIFMPLIDIR